MSYRNRTPRMAALLLGVALGASSLTMLPAADAASHAAHAKADAPAVVTRLSLPKGPVGSLTVIKGTGLATYDANAMAWTAKTVKFGDTTVASSDIAAYSSSTLVVIIPAAPQGTVTVLVGDAAKGPKFTYQASIDWLGSEAFDWEPTSEAGAAGLTIKGDHFSKATKITVGGKAVKIPADGVAADGKKITFDLPAGFTDFQDLWLTDNGAAYWLGLVHYAATAITATTSAESVLVEAATAVTVTGTHLDLVASATFNGEKATFAKATDGGTKMVVTVPKGAAVSGKELVLTTKYGATATIGLDRVAAPTPTVTAVTGVKTTGGEVTLTGTGLTGLKKVVVKNEAGKTFSGSKITVAADGKSATVTLPALAAGDYTISVTAVAATASTEFEFTVAAS